MPLPTNDGSASQPRPQGGLPRPPQPTATPAQPQETAPVGYPAPRGGLPTPTAPPQRPVAPLPPPPPVEEEETFQQLTPEEVAQEDEWEWGTPQQQAPQQQAPQPTPQPAAPPAPAPDPWDLVPAPEPVPQPPPAMESPTHERLEAEESNFVNSKQKKLVPFGGAKSNQKRNKRAKDDNVADFDAREDRRKRARVVQIGALVALFGIVGFGAYNALNPPQGVSVNEMNTAIQGALVQNSFPEERGASFAEDFLGAYLTHNSSDPKSDETLSYYYTGTLGGTSNSTATYEAIGQRLLTTPKVIDYNYWAPNSASYTVGALVAPYSPDDTTKGAKDTGDANAKYKWVYYNVNVYYDVSRDAMAVTADSPTLVPDPNVGDSGSIPDAKLLGTGETVEDPSIGASLRSYFEQFAKASPTSHDGLDAYLVDGANADPDLLTGLADRYELAGDPETAIKYTAYQSDEATDQVKIDTYVTWRDKQAAAKGGTITYTGHYYVVMDKQANGTWLVSKSAPRIYVSAPSS